MKKILTYIMFYTVSILGYAQTVNEGVFTILPGTEVSTVFAFTNKESAELNNDGTIYFYSHFTNDGLYGFSKNKNSSYTVFQPYEEVLESQNFKGSKQSNFYDVLFNNPTPLRAFELEKTINISGIANFNLGIVQVDSLNGNMVFHKGSSVINVSDSSHADGMVKKVGNEEFVYPIGDDGIYRFASISAPKIIKDSFLGKYYLKNSNAEQPHSSKTGVIEVINNKEYWTIERAEGKSDIILSLSWDERTTPADILKNAVDNLHIVRWDAQQKLWVDEGGIVDLNNKTVTTPTTVDGYGIFTLGTVKTDLISDGNVVIYNAVSPNGDGENDYFIIDNIERFPNNVVEIYNRWGVKVYETENYNSNGNVFKGYSEGRVTVKKNDKLPSGTYYYIIKYEYKDKKSSNMIKKSGYLHLEND